MEDKITIIGGGIIGALEAYYAYLEAKKHKKPIRITIYEKNKFLTQTTTLNIVPSLTSDEILAVVPRGSDFIKKLRVKFDEPYGIKIDDVANINDDKKAFEFINALLENSTDENMHNLRNNTLLEMGKHSMKLWQELYDCADTELQQIMLDANFKPCHELQQNFIKLDDRYRIDLIYDVTNAQQKAKSMLLEYTKSGYHHAKILTPKQVLTLDPLLKDFCQKNTILNKNKQLVWKDSAIAIFRPGG